MFVDIIWIFIFASDNDRVKRKKHVNVTMARWNNTNNLVLKLFYSWNYVIHNKFTMVHVGLLELINRLSWNLHFHNLLLSLLFDRKKYSRFLQHELTNSNCIFYICLERKSALIKTVAVQFLVYRKSSKTLLCRMLRGETLLFLANATQIYLNQFN